MKFLEKGLIACFVVFSLNRTAFILNSMRQEATKTFAYIMLKQIIMCVNELLYILTSKWVLHTLFPGLNNLFQIVNIFFFQDIGKRWLEDANMSKTN